MNENDRRNFLLSSRDMVVGALTAGALVACASGGPTVVEAQTSASPSTAGFGWEIDNLSNNGADVYFAVQRSLVLNMVDVDLAFRLSRRQLHQASPRCYANWRFHAAARPRSGLGRRHITATPSARRLLPFRLTIRIILRWDLAPRFRTLS
jgi:hypothetical protein